MGLLSSEARHAGTDSGECRNGAGIANSPPIHIGRSGASPQLA
jgi:hypothetical protein